MESTKRNIGRLAIASLALAGPLMVLVPFFSGLFPPLMASLFIAWIAFAIGMGAIGLLLRRTLLFGALGLFAFPMVLMSLDSLGLSNGYARHPIDQWRYAEAASPTLQAAKVVPFELTNDQLLIVAAFELDVPIVKKLLAKGADPNARLELTDENLFADKWKPSYSPIGSHEWTALQAVANSHREPQPEKTPENTSEALAEARKLGVLLDTKVIDERDRRRVGIAELLLEAGAKLDLDDGHGATALYAAIDNKCQPLALLLIKRGANVNTRTRVYIDGPDNITPLHRAAEQPAVVAALLERGANVHARTSGGDTPLHSAALFGSQESVKLLLAAGADPKTKNDDGKTPGDYSPITIETLGK